MTPARSALDQFLARLDTVLASGDWGKLTLGKPRQSAEPDLRNVFARPVVLRAGPHITFVRRYATRDHTHNLPVAEAAAHVRELLANAFYDAHLFTPAGTAQLEQRPDGTARLRQKSASPAGPALASVAPGHDHTKSRLLPTSAPWLQALGVTRPDGRPREGMGSKLRQIERFAELLRPLLHEAGLLAAAGDTAAGGTQSPVRLTDMGAGKGYLTFALAELLGEHARLTGIERRPELVALGNDTARSCGLGDRLRFVAGDIPTAHLASPEPIDAVIALHACDTATDDALAAGLDAGARLLVVSPCCQKEIRPQLVAPPVLADALRHGIFQERQAEFVTDALRAQLLEAVGCRTRVFEFVSDEHTAKNLLIAAVRPAGRISLRPEIVARARTFAAFYGVRDHRLARRLGIDLNLTDTPAVQAGF